MSEILPNLWLGPMDLTYDSEFLQESHITHVISAFEEYHRTPIMMKLQIQSLCIELYDRDDAPIYDSFEKTCACIEDALKTGAVYVHCLAGISRSPTIVAAYLIHSLGMTVEEALAHIRERRPIIDPNDGFRKALTRWAILKGTQTMCLDLKPVEPQGPLVKVCKL